MFFVNVVYYLNFFDLPYKVVANKECSQNVDEKQNKNDNPAPYLKESDK